MCINKEIFYHMQNKDIYDQSKMCNHFDDDPEKCNGSLGDDSWHCIMKNFAGSCVEADSSGSNMDDNASYMRKRNVPACQQVFIDNITTSASYLGNDPEYTKLTNESLQSGYIYDYISKNSDSMENMCKKIRYPNASITHADESPVSGSDNDAELQYGGNILL